jgi:hypothetical protein
MSRIKQIYKLTEQHKVPVSTVFKEYIITPQKRYEIIAKMTTSEDWDSDIEPEDLDQMCETPPSQNKLLSFF